jgi:biotin transport system ATP-binding protein
VINIDEVSHWFGDQQVLHDINLCLVESRIAVIGANGSGKSTFARLLNGLLVPARGEVRVRGLHTRRNGKAVRRLVSFVFQDPDVQIVMPTVGEDLAFGLKNHGLSRTEIHQRVTHTLERYGLTEHRDRAAHLLSGGQKQLLAIAAVLITGPEYVVFDEPTTLLDLRNKRRINALIRELDQQVVVVTHDLESLDSFDRVIVFDEGRVVADGPPSSSVTTYLDLMSVP